MSETNENAIRREIFDKLEVYRATDATTQGAIVRQQCIDFLADLTAPRDSREAVIEKALVAARTFIRNGVALGFIRMPDPDTPDPAHDTPRLIDEALAIVREKGGGKPMTDPVTPDYTETMQRLSKALSDDDFPRAVLRDALVVIEAQAEELDRLRAENETCREWILWVCDSDVVSADCEKAGRELVGPMPDDDGKHGCSHCGTTFDHEPVTFCVPGIPAQTFLFCSVACRKAKQETAR